MIELLFLINFILLSLKSIHHYENSTDDFVVNEDYLRQHSIHIPIDDLIIVFDQFYSLFSSTTDIILISNNSFIC
jgi:hypothetical protein